LLFEETLKRLAETGEATNQALIRAISLDSLTELHERLAGTAGAALVDPTAERTAASVKMTAVNALRSLKYLPGEGRGETAFSIRGFVEREDDAWLFLSAPADQREALKPLIACWLDVAVRAVMTLQPVRAPRLWLVLDEVASLSKIDSLAVALTEARKYGLCPVLGLQSAAQLRDIYGRDAAQVMLGMLQTWLVLRVADGESAKYLSESLGAHEMQEKDESLSFGAQSVRDGTNLHSKRVQRVAVLPSEIQKLADREGYLALPGPYPIAKIELSIHEKPAVAQAFVSRELAAVKALDVVASVPDSARIAPVRPIL
jgi:type IV secretory pathway TraG/TraD family ATPase VirD4